MIGLLVGTMCSVAGLFRDTMVTMSGLYTMFRIVSSAMKCIIAGLFSDAMFNLADLFRNNVQSGSSV